MYVWRNHQGRFFARHYPSQNSDGHTHAIGTAMSDAHRRQTEYSQRAAESVGLSTAIEFSTGKGTRLDLAIFGSAQNTGFEIQRSELSRVKAKSRATKSFSAGWPTAWISDRERDPDWVDHVPTARFEVRGKDGWNWNESTPPRNSARVVISSFSRERDRSTKSGWWYRRTPKSILLDDLAYLMPAGEIVPVSIGTRGAVALAFKSAVDIIDSCAYFGASRWIPTSDTPRNRERIQEISRSCLHVEQSEYTDFLELTRSGFRPPIGPGRCRECALHVFTQGHRYGCPESNENRRQLHG